MMYIPTTWITKVSQPFKTQMHLLLLTSCLVSGSSFFFFGIKAIFNREAFGIYFIGIYSIPLLFILNKLTYSAIHHVGPVPNQNITPVLFFPHHSLLNKHRQHVVAFPSPLLNYGLQVATRATPLFHRQQHSTATTHDIFSLL